MVRREPTALRRLDRRRGEQLDKPSRAEAIRLLDGLKSGEEGDMRADDMIGAGDFIVLAALVVIYLLPTIIAANRHRISTGPIAAVNIFFGWTLIGWVICLVWALSGNVNSAPAKPGR